MISIQSAVFVEECRGQRIYDFLVQPNDRDYQRWWPGIHLQFHRVRVGGDPVGDLVYMDEYIGKRRLRMQAVVIEAAPGRKITWQMKTLVRLPAWVTIEFADEPEGVRITHTVRAGYTGPGRLLDPLLRLYLTPSFACAMDRHAQFEFRALGRLLHDPRG